MTRNDSSCDHTREQNINNNGVNIETELPAGEEQQTKANSRDGPRSFLKTEALRRRPHCAFVKEQY